MSLHATTHTSRACVFICKTCHLHFWQNDRDFLRATAVTRAWNGYPISVSTESLWPWTRKFSRRSYRDSNPGPFNHESDALTTELSPLPNELSPCTKRGCLWRNGNPSPGVWITFPLIVPGSQTEVLPSTRLTLLSCTTITQARDNKGASLSGKSWKRRWRPWFSGKGSNRKPWLSSLFQRLLYSPLLRHHHPPLPPPPEIIRL